MRWRRRCFGLCAAPDWLRQDSWCLKYLKCAQLLPRFLLRLQLFSPTDIHNFVQKFVNDTSDATMWRCCQTSISVMLGVVNRQCRPWAIEFTGGDRVARIGAKTLVSSTVPGRWSSVTPRVSGTEVNRANHGEGHAFTLFGTETGLPSDLLINYRATVELD